MPQGSRTAANNRGESEYEEAFFHSGLSFDGSGRQPGDVGYPQGVPDGLRRAGRKAGGNSGENSENDSPKDDADCGGNPKKRGKNRISSPGKNVVYLCFVCPQAFPPGAAGLWLLGGAGLAYRRSPLEAHMTHGVGNEEAVKETASSFWEAANFFRIAIGHLPWYTDIQGQSGAVAWNRKGFRFSVATAPPQAMGKRRSHHRPNGN